MIENADTPSNIERISDWILTPESPELKWGNPGDYFVIWIADAPPSEAIQKACMTLQKDINAFPGFALRVVDKPSFGLIANTKTGLGFEDSLRAQVTLEKIIWEIDRISAR